MNTLNRIRAVLFGYQVFARDEMGWAASHHASSWDEAVEWAKCYPAWAHVTVTRFWRVVSVRHAA
jgi:hypothetical protein